MSIGQRINQKRKELGISVDELADMLDKNRATIYRYESDEIENMSLSVIEPLAKALHTSPAYLLGWEPETMILKEDSHYHTENSVATLASLAPQLLDIINQLNSDNINRLTTYAEKLLDLQSEDESIK